MATETAAKQNDDQEVRQGWDPNPMVAVSRRTRNFLFPASVLLREPTEADLVKWYAPKKVAPDKAPEVTNIDEQTLTLQAGITFLGCMTTAWALKDVRSASEAPQDGRGRPVAPPYDKCLLVYPENTTRSTFELPQFRDRATRGILGTEVNKAWMRVLAFLKGRDDELTKKGQLGLWTAVGGYDAPEVMILPLRDILEHKSDLGQQAYGMTLAAIPWHRNATHLGALHDYACHHAQSWPLVDATRKRISAWRLPESP